MTIARAIFSGVVQGLTEFLPISSSGHLVILHHFFGLERPQLLFDVSLHVGTLFAIIIFFWRDLVRLFSREMSLWVYIVLASVPIAITGYYFGDFVESLFGNVRVVGFMLSITGAWLVLGSLASQTLNAKRQTLNWWRALLIGMAQAAALSPGLSRSGTTISTGLLCKLDKELAIRFSFLLAIPAIIGALIFKAKDLYSAGEIIGFWSLFSGMITATIVGLISLKFLLMTVMKGKLYLFSIYCFIVGLTILFLV